MVATTIESLPPGLSLEAMARQLAVWLAPWSAKEVAAMVSTPDSVVDYRTAEAWKSGRTFPQTKHWAAMAARWGRPFLDCVFAPALAEADSADIDVRLERVLRDIDLIRLEIKNERKAGRLAGRAVDAAASAAGGMARRTSTAVADNLVKPVRRTAAAAVICLGLSGSPTTASTPAAPARRES